MVAIALGTRVRVATHRPTRHNGQEGIVVIGTQGCNAVVVELDNGEEVAFLLDELEVI